MDKKTAAIIGLVGAILVLASLALSWASVSGGGLSVDMGGINFIMGSMTIMGQTVPIPFVPEVWVVLAGGVLALVGALGLLSGKRSVGFLTPIGGLLALVGGAWAVVDIASSLGGLPAGVTAGIGIGIYLSIVGGIVAMVGSLGLKKEQKS